MEYIWYKSLLFSLYVQINIEKKNKKDSISQNPAGYILHSRAKKINI